MKFVAWQSLELFKKMENSQVSFETYRKRLKVKSKLQDQVKKTYMDVSFALIQYMKQL